MDISNLVSILNEKEDQFFTERADLYPTHFRQFAEWYKKQGGKISKTSQEGVSLFVGTKDNAADWNWDPEEYVLYFDRANSYAYSKFLTPTS